MLKVKGTYGEYKIEQEGNQLKVNGNEQLIDKIDLNKSHFHILFNNKSFRVELIEADVKSKSFVIKVNGNVYELEAQDEMDMLLEKLGMEKLSASTVDDLKAPMPGLVIDINVVEGQELKKGDPLVILEAMKMENVLKAPADLKVTEIAVEKGQTVDKNTVLIKF